MPGPISQPQTLADVRTLPQMLRWRVKATPAAEAYRHFDADAGRWISQSWHEIDAEFELWRRALADAMRLKMPADALASLARLRTVEAGLRDTDVGIADGLDKLFLAHDAEWRKTAERSAATLGAGDYGGDERACASTSLAS